MSDEEKKSLLTDRSYSDVKRRQLRIDREHDPSVKFFAVSEHPDVTERDGVVNFFGTRIQFGVLGDAQNTQFYCYTRERKGGQAESDPVELVIGLRIPGAYGTFASFDSGRVLMRTYTKRTETQDGDYVHYDRSTHAQNADPSSQVYVASRTLDTMHPLDNQGYNGRGYFSPPSMFVSYDPATNSIILSNERTLGILKNLAHAQVTPNPLKPQS